MTQDPLTPSDCDLRDFQFMPVEVDRVLKSETWVLGTGDERSAAMTLWLQSWHQVPAGSLPNVDKMLAHLAASPKWLKVKEHALRGWLQCSDGRLYHPVVCEKVLEAWIEKLLNSLSGSTGNAKRWNVEIDVSAIRAQLLLAIRMLRDLAPQSKTLKKKAVVSVAAGSHPDSPPDVAKPSPPDSLGDRKGQGQGQGQGLSIKAHTGNSTGVGSDQIAFAPTKAGQVGMGLKALGVDMTKVNLSDPLFAELLTQGATVDEFLGLAQEAIQGGKRNPWRWALTVLPERRKDAQEMQLAPQSQPVESQRQRATRDRVAEASGVYADAVTKAPARPLEPAQVDQNEVIHAPAPIALGND